MSFLLGGEGLAAQAAGHVADGILQGLVLAVEGFAVFRHGFDLGGDGFETGLHVLGASGGRKHTWLVCGCGAKKGVGYAWHGRELLREEGEQVGRRFRWMTRLSID